MAMSTPAAQQLRLILWAVVLTTMACADGGAGGCGGCGEGCGVGTTPYPNQGAIIDQSLQVRLTPDGLGFLEENAGPLVNQVLGQESLSFCIPPGNQAGIQFCHLPAYNDCGEQGAGCLLDTEVDHLEIQPLNNSPEDDAIEVTIVLTDINERFPVDGGFPCFDACDHMIISSDALPVTATIVFHQDSNDRTWFEVADIGVDAEALNFSNDATDPGEQLTCACWGGALEFLDGILGAFVGEPIQQAIDEQLCTQCPETGTCPEGTYCGGDPEVCRYEASDICVPLQLGTEGAFDLGASLADMTETRNGVLNFLLYLANYADAEANGMSLGGQLGFHAEHDACVPMQPPPDVSTVPKSGQLISNQTPTGASFMIGVAVSKTALDLALWSVYTSGAMCLAVDNATVEQLTSSTLSIILQSLPTLTENQNVPLMVRVRPTEAPYVELGRGTVTGDPPAIQDPLITLHIDRLQIDFYAYIEERIARIFTLDTDLAVPIALTPSDDGGGIQVLIGDLEAAFTRVQPVDAELLAQADVDRLADVLPGLVAGLLPAFASALEEPIAIPGFAGYRLALGQDSFTGIEGNTMLGIFADLEPDPNAGAPSTGMMSISQATAAIEAVYMPSDVALADFEARRMRGEPVSLEELRTEVVLAVDTIDPTGDTAEREYSYRIDGGAWHLYRSGPTLTLRDPAFFIEGRHTIEVRSRVPGRTRTLSLISAPVDVTIDLASPEVALRRLDEGLIEVEARDNVWSLDELTMRVRFGEGDWSAPRPIHAVELPRASGTGREVVAVQVEVTDPAGRQRLATQTFAMHGREHIERQGGGGCQDCSVAGGSPWGGAPILLAVLALAVAPLRRRARLVSVAALATLAMACADDKPANSGNGGEDAGNDTPVRTCADGCGAEELCIDDRCVENICAIDDDCPDTMTCTDARCVIAERCESHATCPAGQFCMDNDDDGGSECTTVPCDGNGACAELACSSGQLPYCSESACACEVPCPEGCGDGQFCCNTTRACIDLPAVCEGLTCDVGFGPGIATPAAGDPDTCEITGPECECQELPPLPIGDVGAYLSAAVGPDDTIYVSAFNRTYEDLMFGVVQEDGTVAWQFLDGVPDTGTVTGSLGGPRGGIADPGPRVGRYTSIAVAGDGVIHLSYFDRNERVLRYARGEPENDGFKWTFETVDATIWAGLYTSLTLDANDVPGIAYMVQRAESEPGVMQAQVRYAWADATLPTAWTLETIDGQVLAAPCGGSCLGATRCHAETNRCERTTTSSGCTPSCSGDQICFESEGGNTCGTSVASGGLFFLDEGVGLFADSDRFTTGEVAVVYYDHTGGNLRYAASVGRTFAGVTPQILDGEGPDGADEDLLPDDTGDVGWYPAVTVGPDDAVHITYVDATNDDLRYLRLGDAGPSVVDSGVRGTASEVLNVLVGDDSSVVILDGVVQVAYMDSTRHDALVTQRSNESGLWLPPETVLGDEDPYTGAFGFYLNQLVVGGETVLLSYRINTREAVRDVAVETLE